MGQVEGYIKTTDANNYIANQGTVSTTNNLAGLPLTHYNCTVTVVVAGRAAVAVVKVRGEGN